MGCHHQRVDGKGSIIIKELMEKGHHQRVDGIIIVIVKGLTKGDTSVEGLMGSGMTSSKS